MKLGNQIAFVGITLLTVSLTVSARAGLVAQYHFDEAPGETIAADSAGSVDGTLSDGATFVTGGVTGNAVDLTAASALVSMGNNFGLTGIDFTIVLWVNTTTTGDDIFPLSKHAAGTNNGYVLQINQNAFNGAADKAMFIASHSPGNGPISTTSVNDGAWHQIVGVHEVGVSSQVFVDGAPAEASSGPPAVGSNTADFLLGGFFNAGSPIADYTGLVDELQIYDQALTSDQIDFLFNNPAQAIPEPAALALLGAGLLSFASARRRRWPGGMPSNS